MTHPEVAHGARLRRAVCPQQEQRSGGQENEDLPRLAEVVRDPVLAEETREAGRDRGDDDEPGDPLVGRLDAPSSEGHEQRPDETHEVAPEVRGDGDERSEVQRDVERLVEAVVLLEVRPLGGPGHEDEVARRRDRQELGQPLNQPEDEGLAVRDGVRVVPHSEEREDDGETERGPRDAEHDGAAHGEILRSCPHARSRKQKGRKLRQSGERPA